MPDDLANLGHVVWQFHNRMRMHLRHSDRQDSMLSAREPIKYRLSNGRANVLRKMHLGAGVLFKILSEPLVLIRRRSLFVVTGGMNGVIARSETSLIPVKP